MPYDNRPAPTEARDGTRVTRMEPVCPHAPTAGSKATPAC